MTAAPIIRVAAVQIAPDLETSAGTVERVSDGYRRGGRARGARLVVFPETFVPWYPYFSFVRPPVLTGAEHVRLYENAVVVPGAGDGGRLECRRAVMRSSWRSASTNGMAASLYNAQIIFDATGELVLKRRKNHAYLPRADDLGPGRRVGPASG